MSERETRLFSYISEKRRRVVVVVVVDHRIINNMEKEISLSAVSEGIRLDATTVRFTLPFCLREDPVFSPRRRDRKRRESSFDVDPEEHMRKVYVNYSKLSKQHKIKKEYLDLKEVARPYIPKDVPEDEKHSFRLMQWNVLAKNLANDGFFVNPVISDWPVRRDSFPVIGGGAEKIHDMIDAMQRVTEVCQDEMRQEEEYYVKEGKKEREIVECLREIESGSKSHRPMHSMGSVKRLGRFGSKDTIPSNPKDLEKLMRYDDKALFERYGVSNQYEFDLLLFTALKLQAAFRGKKGRSHARLEKKYIKKKVERMKLLQRKYATVDMERNGFAVLDWEPRWCRIKQRIYDARPDILTLTEVDTLAEMQRDLGEMGYACGFSGCTHVPMHASKPDDMSFLDFMRRSGIAFAPCFASTALALGIQSLTNKKTLSKAASVVMDGDETCISKKSWNARSLFKDKRFWKKGGTKKLFQELQKLDSDVPNADELDDDCSVVFWRKDRFRVIRIDYLDMSTKKKYKSAVCVCLKDALTGKTVKVFTCHLASGASLSDNKKRLSECYSTFKCAPSIYGTNATMKEPVKEVRGLYGWLQKESSSSHDAACVLAFDANSRPQFQAPRTVWKVFKGMVKDDDGDDDDTSKKDDDEDNIIQGWDSVWDKYFDVSGKPREQTLGVDPPVTVNKMRGATSNQPRKIGAHAYELIDYVFFDSKRLKLIQHALQPLQYPNDGIAKSALIPDLATPSDHTPIVVDFCFH